MGFIERKSYLIAILSRYPAASRADKTKILDEFCAVCNYNRKYAIRILNRGPTIKKKRSGPKPVYQDQAILDVLKKIWFAADQPCSLKLIVIIPKWLPCYEEKYGAIEDEVKQKLLSISRSTIDRLLKPVRAKSKPKGQCTTKPSTFKTKIPVQMHHWDIDKPGYVEADTVAHCGDSIAGKFAWSLTVTDLFTGWTENRAVWNKYSEGVYQAVSFIEAALPFETLGFHSDNGSEFMNHIVYDYFTNRTKPVLFTRSRPYRKNDNAHVEQKNYTHVRQLLGYDRLDRKSVVYQMNELYRHEWSLYQNHFIPSVKLIYKERVGSRYKKIYDMPKTPYERVLESDFVDNKTKDKLRAIHRSLNPFTLKDEIERKLSVIFKNLKVTSNVRHRL
tara:strand:+ start:51 stop:1217 length:1167 start_codon:yes stop_codon:yes gene_type:complete